MSTRAQILAEIAAQFPDNTTGLITPAKLRQVVEDVTNSCLVSETDAGTAGRAVLQAGTPAQVRAAAGLGGSYTVAQLAAFSEAERPALAFCTNCLTTSGVGSLVYWSGTAWFTCADGFVATTDPLEYFRGVRASGAQFFNVYCKGNRLSSLPFGPATTTSGGGTNSSHGNGEATVVSLAASGGQVFVGNADLLRLAGGATIPATTSAYLAEDVFFSRDSVVDDDYRYCIGFRANPNAATTIASDEVLFVLDRANALAIGNTGNSKNWLTLTRAASTNTLTVTAVPPGLTLAERQTIEMLYTAGSVKFYIAGVLVAEHTTNIPSSAITGASFAFVKTSGSTAVSGYRFCPYVSTRS